MARPVILASASPRRRALLEQVGLAFTVQDSAVDEDAIQAGEPAALVQLRAAAKGRAVADTAPDAVVVAADTVVSLDGCILGKPRDAREAAAMLARLAGRSHSVFTGVWIGCRALDKQVEAVETTHVTMRPLTLAQRQAYVASGEPLDKAGAYAIQGLGSLLVTEIHGCFYNVVGLPLPRCFDLLSQFGIDLLASRPLSARPGS